MQLKSLTNAVNELSVSSQKYIDYPQFEHLLKLISVKRSQKLSISENIKQFLHLLSQFLSIPFILTTQSRRQMIKYSMDCPDLNKSSSSLDLSIKEALDTLKVSSKRQSVRSIKESLSPRSAKMVYSNCSTPSSLNNRGYQLENYVKTKKTMESSQTSKNLRINKGKSTTELDEFLEAEQLAHREAFTFNVKDVKKSVHKNPDNVKRLSSPIVLNKPKCLETVQKYAKKFSSLHKNNHITVSLTKPIITSIRNHRNFIVTIKQNYFSHKLVIGAIFRAWKTLLQKRELSCIHKN